MFVRFATVPLRSALPMATLRTALAGGGTDMRSETRTRSAQNSKNSGRLLLLAAAAAFGISGATGATAAAEPGATAQAPTFISAPFERSSIRYDAEYPTIGYGENPSNNAIARLQERVKRGEVNLELKPPRGYLDSVLNALGIDASSQTLVYSKTSLQLALINAATPRAIYFDDDTYVAWIPGTKFLEIATMDSAVGPVFYTLSNTSPTEVRIDRETSRCLTCHDTWGMAGGGVPRFLFLSSLVDEEGETLSGQPGEDTTDRTPIRDRWAGWYVTGQHGRQEHLGNILVGSDTDVTDITKLRHGNIDSLRDLFDSRPYVTDKSDIVALLIFEHQAYVGNLITRANYKSRTLLQRNGLDPNTASSWSDLPPAVQRPLKLMLEPLVQAMLFVDAAAITSEIRSSSGFDKWFQSKGPRDSSGRSLRDLDLRTKLFKHPLSYLIYSKSFNGLLPSAKEYVYTRLADILTDREQKAGYAHISMQERGELLEMLVATKPDFAALYAQRKAQCKGGDCPT